MYKEKYINRTEYCIINHNNIYVSNPNNRKAVQGRVEGWWVGGLGVGGGKTEGRMAVFGAVEGGKDKWDNIYSY